MSASFTEDAEERIREIVREEIAAREIQRAGPMSEKAAAAIRHATLAEINPSPTSASPQGKSDE